MKIHKDCIKTSTSSTLLMNKAEFAIVITYNKIPYDLGVPNDFIREPDKSNHDLIRASNENYYKRYEQMAIQEGLREFLFRDSDCLISKIKEVIMDHNLFRDGPDNRELPIKEIYQLLLKLEDNLKIEIIG
jgi:hypothetical protein